LVEMPLWRGPLRAGLLRAPARGISRCQQTGGDDDTVRWIWIRHSKGPTDQLELGHTIMARGTASSAVSQPQDLSGLETSNADADKKQRADEAYVTGSVLRLK
jgi:hypothetical protein